MAWEKFSQRSSTVLLVVLSLVWAALVIAGARLTNFDEPYLPFAIGGALVFLLRAKLSRWEIYLWLLASALLVKVIHLPQIPFWVLRVAASLAVLGFAAIFLLGLRILWSEHEDRHNAIALLAPCLILILFIVGCARLLSFSGGFAPQTDDAWLYAFDGSLGFQPSFAVGRIMYDSLVLTATLLLTYLALPFAMAVVCACRIPRDARRISWHMLLVLLLAGIGGGLLFNILPGTGPIYAFHQDFPWKAIPYKDLSSFVLQKMSLPTGIPRNAMPSLHVAWTLLLYWNSREFRLPLRLAVLVFFLLTVLATLGSGQHYLVDLVVSLPLALAVQSAAALLIRGASNGSRSRQLSTLLVGIALSVGWLLLVRFGVALALRSRAIPWILIAATVAITLWLQSRISAADSTAGAIALKSSSEAVAKQPLPGVASL
jgi:hypothetical protein